MATPLALFPLLTRSSSDLGCLPRHMFPGCVVVLSQMPRHTILNVGYRGMADWAVGAKPWIT
ncbi:predicted protein [Plenodomus lingam JN3]|uniref:Uncharacterized protein n=1 Tax=Leptosphaeria maculans (strain JN3 / isolate v23.1.3 / race Av1-4-5-6-7-8) TaxID=985895 RepID=M1ZJQ7_LEPMJ|nr:predicted protein [Plenodomus lingam JN3]